MKPSSDSLVIDQPKHGQSAVSFDVARIREDFPILKSKSNGKPLVYLDNAATTQKPQQVLDRLTRYYSEENANVHRGVHWLSERATEVYEDARGTIRRLINAPDVQNIVFVRGTTEGINLVAQSWGRHNVRRDDEIVISTMEHHSNIMPWQMLCEETGARLRVIPITDAGELDLEAYEQLLTDRTRIVAIVHVSNALGTINPAAEMIRIAHRRGIPVLVDGAQAIAHMKVDVQALGADFYAFSGHKMLGPTGIGVLYGTSALLEAMPPYQGGGDMIRSVTFDRTLYNSLPYKFEAGTPDIAGVVALGAAIDYLNSAGLDAIAAHEHQLVQYGTEVLSQVPGVHLVGTAADKAGIFSFVVDGVHPHDVGTIVDREGIAIRTGHHCCQPLMHRLGVAATARASMALYNTREEIDALAAALGKVHEVFA